MLAENINIIVKAINLENRYIRRSFSIKAVRLKATAAAKQNDHESYSLSLVAVPTRTKGTAFLQH